MHSVLQDEWSEADSGRGEHIGVQYLGQRSGEDFDYHMWTVKVDRPDATAADTVGEEGGTEEASQASRSEATGSDRLPQEPSGRGTRPGKSGTTSFKRDELQGEQTAECESARGAGGKSIVGDPNEDLNS
jgi:hypothetical protein